jgi:hypothetical protein
LKQEDLSGAFPELQAWAEEMKDHPVHGNKNPMVRKYGLGPKGKKCLDCEYGFFNSGNTKKFYKCKLRGVSNGQATDHSSRFQACSKFKTDVGFQVLEGRA